MLNMNVNRSMMGGRMAIRSSCRFQMLGGEEGWGIRVGRVGRKTVLLPLEGRAALVEGGARLRRLGGEARLRVVVEGGVPLL